MTIWNMLFSIVVTLAITIVVHAQTNETECKKASASDVCCKKPGCMWVSCMHTPYFQKPIPLTECHATSWELEVCKTIPDIVCPTGIGAFCRDVGGECEDIPGAYCNTSANMQYNIAKANCQCAAIYLPGNRHDTNCTAISCNNNSTCVSLDPNSECVNSKCACRGGFEINRNSSVGLCVLKSATTIAPAATTITDKCGSYGDNKTACCTAAATEGCKYVTCSMNGTVGVCYKLDSNLDTKCENVTTMKPADQCSTLTTPTPDPCAAFTDQGACCGASIQCHYINCTDKDSQAHTGCHGKNSDLTSVCSKVETNMCTADPETSPTPSSSPKPSTDSPSSLPSTNTTQDTSMTPKRSETSANTGEEHSQHFDAASFVGGIILCAGIVAIAFFGWKFYKAGTEKPYQSL